MLPKAVRPICRCAFLIGTMTALTGSVAGAPEATMVPLIADRWTLSGDGAFAVDPIRGPIIQLRRGSAIMKGLAFANGTIEFDIGLKQGGVVGLTFRQKDPANAEVFYFRPQANCDRSDDCVQYMPLSHGAFEWDLYPQYETAAPIRANDWNHVRLVISGRRLNAFINGAAKPTLSIGRLAGSQNEGTIAFHGPADIANLHVAPGKTDGLSATPVRLPGDADPNLLRHWALTRSVPMSTVMDASLKLLTGRPPAYADMPRAASSWRTIQAEPDGLVNFSREIGSSADKSQTSLAWAKTTVTSDRAQIKDVSFGWARETWVFVNGKQVFADRNFYGVPGASKEPDGRVSLRNGAMRIPLRKGRNVIAVALDDNFGGNSQHFGWGMKMRWHDTVGLVRS